MDGWAQGILSFIRYWQHVCLNLELLADRLHDHKFRTYKFIIVDSQTQIYI